MEHHNEILERLHRIELIMERNTTSLEEHMRRTEVLEQKMEHVDTHVKMVNGIVKFLLALSALTALFKMIK